MSQPNPEILTFGIQTPDGQLPPLEVCKALYEAAQLATRQAQAEEKERFRVDLLAKLRQHRDSQIDGLEMLMATSCTLETIQAQEDHLKAIDLCIERLDYTPQPAWPPAVLPTIEKGKSQG